MKLATRLSALAAAALLCQLTFAQATSTPSTAAAKPANATGICRDGSYSIEASKSGACRGHHGVKEWYTPAAPSAAAASDSTTTPSAVAPVAPATPSSTTQVRTQSQAAAQSAGQSTDPLATQSIKKGPAASVAPGGGPGIVWVNIASNVYHCFGSDYYGKTKVGAYMTEADAKAKGAHGVRGKTCSK
jgi:hypothetical protein